MAQYVFTMNRVGKIVPPKRQILKGVSLSFFPGAKIGVLGLNGSGKSTLLRIMAPGKNDNETPLRIWRLGGTILPTRFIVKTYCAICALRMCDLTERDLDEPVIVAAVSIARRVQASPAIT